MNYDFTDCSVYNQADKKEEADLYEEAKRRITRYYELLAQKESNPSAAETMNRIVDYLNYEETIVLEKKLATNDGVYKRIMAYAPRLSEMMVKESSVPYNLDSHGKNAKTMNELYAALSGYDSDQEITESINGNTFTYKNTFPIEEYREELSEIGDIETGNRWYVRLDDGRLMIY